MRCLRGTIDPMRLAALAMDMPLHALPGAEALLTQNWPQALARVLTLIARAASRAGAAPPDPRLTAIDDDVSLPRYSDNTENPPALGPRRRRVERSPSINTGDMFRPLPVHRARKTAISILVAGCGTGWHATGIAQKFIGPGFSRSI